MVKVGRKPGLYNTWEKCKEQVDGFSGAVFKKFDNADKNGIIAFLNGTSRFESKPCAKTNNIMIAYTDGSYNPQTNICGAGVVIFYQGQKSEISILDNNTEAAVMRNVAGEIRAVLIAMEQAYEKKVDKLIIYHDYNGVSEWANDHWKAKNPFTQEYKHKVFEFRKYFEIEFKHVNAHTGDTYNELADNLAKAAVGL